MTSHAELGFLAGGGELGALIRAFDWSATPLGRPEQWPQSLKTATAILLRSPVPIVLLWGPQGIMIYNDAYASLEAVGTRACSARPCSRDGRKSPTSIGA